MKKIRITSVAKTLSLFLAFSLFLGGCSGGNSVSTSSQFFDQIAETAASAISPKEVPMGIDYEVMEEGYDYDYGMAVEPLSFDSEEIIPVVSANRKLIRNVSLDVETDKFDDFLNQIQTKITELSGYIESSDISNPTQTYDSGSRRRYASMSVRIPSEKLDLFITAVEQSCNVTYKSENTQDVTLQYSDLESLKKTLSMEQERIWALLEKADTLEAVIALEERLSEIRYDLESIESHLKLFDNQIQYSTVKISINETTLADLTPTAPETIGQRIQRGFSRNVTNLLQTITDLFILLIVGIPVWMPFLLFVALIFIAVRYSSKKRLKLSTKAKKSDSASQVSPETTSSPSEQKMEAKEKEPE